MMFWRVVALLAYLLILVNGLIDRNALVDVADLGLIASLVYALAHIDREDAR